MIETLLKLDLPKAYDINRSFINLSYRKEFGVFEIGDLKPCVECKSCGKYPERSNCNEKQLKINANNHPITVVEYEQYMNQFNGKRYAAGGRCDLMMFDEDAYSKIAFCDLGCYSENHVEKKQRIVYKQVTDSLNRFLSKVCGKSFLNRFAEIVLIFGRRDPVPIVRTKETQLLRSEDVKGNMLAFMKTPISSKNYATSQEIAGDVKFSFIVVNYPAPYGW